MRSSVTFLRIDFFRALQPKAFWEKEILKTLVLCLLLAVAVEIGQLFIPLRTFDWADICYALVGTLLGFIIGILFIQFKKLVSRV